MASRRELVQPYHRKGFWYLIKHVSREFEAYDKRRLVMLSTGMFLNWHHFFVLHALAARPLVGGKLSVPSR